MSIVLVLHSISFFFFFNDTATTEIYTLSLHDALPISFSTKSTPSATSMLSRAGRRSIWSWPHSWWALQLERSEEHTSELQSQSNLVCRLLLEKKKNKTNTLNAISPCYRGNLVTLLLRD